MWIDPLEKLPKNNEVVLCAIEGEYEVGVFEKTNKKFRHTLGRTSLDRVDAWLPIPEYVPKKTKKVKANATILPTKKSKAVLSRKASRSKSRSRS